MNLQKKGCIIIAEIKLSLNGEILAVYNESKIIQLWDIESGLIFAELTGIIMDLESLVISSDNTTLFSLDKTHVVLKWDIP